jgi:hypothetical protein
VEVAAGAKLGENAPAASAARVALAAGLFGRLNRRPQYFFAPAPVASAMLVVLQRVENAKRFRRVPTNPKAVHVHVLDHIVRVDGAQWLHEHLECWLQSIKRIIV